MLSFGKTTCFTVLLQSELTSSGELFTTLGSTLYIKNNLICCSRTGLIWVVKGAMSLFNHFAAMLQDKTHVFCGCGQNINLGSMDPL